jgi:hypothetical protein
VGTGEWRGGAAPPAGGDLAPAEAEVAERRTSPVELLWDLVFVFAVTQVTTLPAAHPRGAGAASRCSSWRSGAFPAWTIAAASAALLLALCVMESTATGSADATSAGERSHRPPGSAA